MGGLLVLACEKPGPQLWRERAHKKHGVGGGGGGRKRPEGTEGGRRLPLPLPCIALPTGDFSQGF